MGNLLKMDLYRMNKSRSFRVCLILAFVLALIWGPIIKGLSILVGMLGGDVPASMNATEMALADIIADPFIVMNAMLILLSASSFFYADIEHGYIKNIAGQMPKKGYTVLSKFLAMIPHNLVFMLAGVAGNLIGSLICFRITGGSVLDAVRIFVLKFLLIQSICAILLLLTATLRSKSFGAVVAVLFGLGLLSLIYSGLDAAIGQVWKDKPFKLWEIMPDQVMGEKNPDTVRALLVAAVTTVLFLPAAIKGFDKRDVK